MQQALEKIWPYTQEWFMDDRVDEACAAQGIAPLASSLQAPWLRMVTEVLTQATLKVPEFEGHQKGGKRGVHTEHLGYMLADMQFLQRTYPGAQW
jgi:ring-1,2-phenylacetyl-CoA epoxidase subunit PaaC